MLPKQVGQYLMQRIRSSLNIVAITALCLGGGFVGGMIVPWWLGWIPSVEARIDDAISIANTYIVFTTIIFVAATVILVVVGFLFAKQFADSKELQSKELFDEILSEIKSSKEKGDALARAIFENPQITNHIKNSLDAKIESNLEGVRNSLIRSIEEHSEAKSDELFEQMTQGAHHD
uniref:Uncharacterized protein n=1 Tax=Candidatus Kentrum sp. LFY TaxID=2126342 RepID=A0A450U515_9GAMM|nr:MAG: hypothetical protein BECKLFY1418B_GA0070995_100226 [Candidatus Kentron sp. LFY]